MTNEQLTAALREAEARIARMGEELDRRGRRIRALVSQSERLAEYVEALGLTVAAGTEAVEIYRALLCIVEGEPTPAEKSAARAEVLQRAARWESSDLTIW